MQGVAGAWAQLGKPAGLHGEGLEDPAGVLTVPLPTEQSFPRADAGAPSRFTLKHSGLCTSVSVRRVAKHVGRPHSGQSHGALQGWPGRCATCLTLF